MVRSPRGRLAQARGEETRARIVACALGRFRKKGLGETTMRDIAEDAGVALGAAYYYFPSKDAIVMTYYEQTQRVCAERAREAFAKTTDVRERLGAAIHTKLDVLARDRKLLSALFETLADPAGDLSVFGRAARDVREDSIRIFDEAIATAPEAAAIDPSTRRVLALALWSLHMGLMLYFIRDGSPRAEKTRQLADRSLDFVCRLLPVAPALGPQFGNEIAGILGEAGLLE